MSHSICYTFCLGNYCHGPSLLLSCLLLSCLLLSCLLLSCLLLSCLLLSCLLLSCLGTYCHASYCHASYCHASYFHALELIVMARASSHNYILYNYIIATLELMLARAPPIFYVTHLLQYLTVLIPHPKFKKCFVEIPHLPFL